MKENITGMMVYYYFVCKRKLWYFCHEITMETENEDVLLGKLLDESSYKKNDKHISIDQIINIDFMKEFGELHEVNDVFYETIDALGQVKNESESCMR